jgi:hypothetical protein
MKRQWGLSVVAVLVLGALIVASCANPLESTAKPEPLQHIDTLLLMDTLFMSESVLVTDTVVIVDTVREVDTVIVTDSVFQVDTVFVSVPDTSDCGRMCAELSSHSKKIVWLLDNDAGRYRLEFDGEPERQQPRQRLFVEMGGKTYQWTVQDNPTLIIDVDLSADDRITISSCNPHAFGHAIAICVTTTPL